MISNKYNNKIYLLLTALLFLFTLSLNFYNKISDCSLAFTFMVVILNLISGLYGGKKAILSITLCIITSSALLLKSEYYIHGELISGIIPMSLLAALISSYAGLYVFFILKLKYNFYVRNFFGLLSCAVTDGLVMSLFFVNIFSLDQSLSIFYKETAYKVVYSLIASLTIWAVSYALKKTHIGEYKTI